MYFELSSTFGPLVGLGCHPLAAAVFTSGLVADAMNPDVARARFSLPILNVASGFRTFSSLPFL
jgi:hypothetical protein